MLIKKEQSVKHENSKNCTVWEYEYQSEDSSLATGIINGRYPEKGKGCNLNCEQIFFVISGTGKITTESSEYDVKEGDLVHIKKNEKYFVEGQKLFIIITNSPKWTFEQYKHFEN